MKTNALQKFIIAASVAALPGYRAFAQTPTIFAVPAATINAMERGGAGATQQDQIKADAAAQAISEQARGERRAKIGYEKPENIHFSFKPPATTRRVGHPGDRDIKLTDEQIGKLNEIGEALVEFVDSTYRIGTNENAKVGALLKERDEETTLRLKALGDAQKKREEAQIAVLDVVEKLKTAKADRDEYQKAFDEAQGRRAELEAKINQERNDIDALNQSIRKIEESLSLAEKEADAAAEKSQANEEERANYATALGKAKDDFVKATNALAAATANAGKADEALKGAREKAKAAHGGVDVAEKHLAAAEDALRQATSADATAKKTVAKAERALMDAKTAEAKAKDAKNAADKVLAAARPANPEEKQGFWARRALRRAERRAKAAADALGAATAAVPEKKGKLDAARKDAADAAKGLKEKTDARAAAAEKNTAAAKAAKDAESAVEAEQRKVKDINAEIEKQKKAGAKAQSDIEKFDGKLADATKEGKALADNAKEADEKRSGLQETMKKINEATDKGNKANIVHEYEMTTLEDSVSKALDALETAKGKVEEIEKLDTPEIHSALDNARAEETVAGDAYRKALAAQNRVAADARVEAQRDEKKLEASNEANRKEFWNLFREEMRMSAADVPGASLSKAEKDRDTAVAAEKDASDKVETAAAALAAAKDASSVADKALAAAKSAVKSAQDEEKKGAAEKAFAAAEEAANAARVALAKAVGEKDAADDALKGARKELAKAKDAVAVAGKGVSGARAETDRAVDVLIAAFDEQVAETQRRKLAAIGWQLMDATEQERQLARDARRKYFAARKEYAASRKALVVQRSRYENNEIQWDTAEYVNARKDYSEKRTAFEEAEDNYNKYFSDSHTFRMAPLSDAEADGRYITEEALRALHGVQFRGDRRWLARASVNGEPLLDSFLGEMEWQADQVGERDPADPAKVKLTPAQAADCAREAAATVQRRAIYGGFYFAGLQVELENDIPVCFVDKGRYGPISIVFVDNEGNSLDTGRIYNETNILAKLGSKAGDTNALDAVREGEAFNFIEFRKNFNALNANPDIAKADAEFKPASGFDYGFEAEDEGMGMTRTTRAIAANVTVQEKPWPAPVHGVVSIDNFNSMGAADKPLGETDTWMARLTLQSLDLWDRGHALTGNGNVSLGGSLYGGALSYYIPRTESSWEDGAWRQLSEWSWTMHGGYTDVDQGDVIKGLDVLGTGYYAGLQASSRLMDFDASTLDLSLGLTYRYVENAVRIEGEEIKLGPNGGDGYTILPLSIALMYADKGLDDWRGRNYATVEGVINLGGSSAEELSAFRSAIDDDRYMLLRAQFARLQLMWEDSTSFLLPRLLFLRADAQWANTAVIGAEQYGLGGHGTIRGYAEREFMGDAGVSGTFEFRTPIGLGYFDRTEANAYQAADRLQLVYFLDYGWYQLQDARRSENGSLEDDSEFLFSIGAGLRYSYNNLVFRFDWGVPLVRKDEFETSSAGVGHLSLQYQF